ncbi:hypothetical protein FQZ97_744770 [compost metagenome]
MAGLWQLNQGIPLAPSIIEFAMDADQVIEFTDRKPGMLLDLTGLQDQISNQAGEVINLLQSQRPGEQGRSVTVLHAQEPHIGLLILGKRIECLDQRVLFEVLFQHSGIALTEEMQQLIQAHIALTHHKKALEVVERVAGLGNPKQGRQGDLRTIVRLVQRPKPRCSRP